VPKSPGPLPACNDLYGIVLEYYFAVDISLHLSTSVATFVDELRDVITSFAGLCADNIVILRYLNAPGVDGSHIDVGLATLFESFGMTQFVNSPHRGDSQLDVIAFGTLPLSREF